MFIVPILVVLFVLVVVWWSVKVVPEYRRLVVLRLGRCVGARGPGLVFLLPIVDRPVWTDLREQYLEIPHQTCISKDNAAISIDFLVYWKVVDPVLSVVEVHDFAGASQNISTTTLRAVIGDISLDDVLAKREHINESLRVKLDEVTERWGVKVTAVEIREVLPPREVSEAMTRQMSAERTRRATVTEADGKREAAIKVADGERQSAVLRAEGEKQSSILRAEGEKTAQLLRAEGYSQALRVINDVAVGLDSRSLSLQYLESLRVLGSSQSTKLIFPMEFEQFLRPIAGAASAAMAGATGQGSPSPQAGTPK
jgi:regulator of protease activity HflC (stomatin/prohibitin superfamily)